MALVQMAVCKKLGPLVVLRHVRNALWWEEHDMHHWMHGQHVLFLLVSPPVNRLASHLASQRGSRRGNQHLCPLGNQVVSPLASHLANPLRNRRVSLAVSLPVSHRDNLLDGRPRNQVDNRLQDLRVNHQANPPRVPLDSPQVRQQIPLGNQHRNPLASLRLSLHQYLLVSPVVGRRACLHLSRQASQRASLQDNQHQILLVSRQASPRIPQVNPHLSPQASRLGSLLDSLHDSLHDSLRGNPRGNQPLNQQDSLRANQRHNLPCSPP